MKSSKFITVSSPLISSLFLMVALAFAPGARAGFAPFPYSEGFETNLNTNYWTLPVPWGPTWEVARSGVSCLADSPWMVYGASTDASAQLGVDLRFSIRPMLTFWQLYVLQSGQDYGFVEVSRDQGASWNRLSAVTATAGYLWTQVQVDLSEYAGSQTLIRFRLKSDATFQFDGWYIDDLQVSENTAPRRSSFYDAMDTADSATNWLASVWQQVVGGPTNAGSGMSWRCLIGNGSQPGGDLSCPLTLASKLNLGAAVNPKLSFWWRAGSQHGNLLYAQVSTDGGRNWTSIWSWDSMYDQSIAWTRQQVNLNSYIGQTNLALRLLAYNRPPGYRLALDFQVDDVLVDEAPMDVGLTVAGGTDPRHNALLSWTPATASDFAYYAIYRSTSSGVDLTDTLVTSISNKATVSFQDTNLPVANQTYYYRVLVYDTQGLHNWGTNDVSYVTQWGQLAGFPFTDGFESGDAYWACDLPWAISTEPAHGGTHCLSDSPGATYANGADLSAYLRINLGTATRPMLSFWQRYGLETGLDFGFVEVSSNNGSTWTRCYGVTSQSGSNWTKVQVDLGAYAGTQSIIRFRLKTDSANPYDGWYLDDVEVKDFGATALGYPFADNADTTASPSNWVSSAWQQVPGSATTNSGGSWRCLIGSGSQPVGGDYNFNLTLNGTINLQGAVNPKLWFWWRAGSQNGNLFYAQVSTDGGKNWAAIFGWDSMYDQSKAWTRQQLDLNTYIGVTNLTIRFLAYNRAPGYRFALDFQVDDILVGEQPAPPPEIAASVSPGADPRHSAILSWSSSAAPAFASYGIYRSTSPSVTVGNQLVTNISNRSTLSFQDTGLDVCGQTYYYRVIVWDTNSLHNLGTNDLAYKTSWGQNITSLPFADGLEGTDANWACDRPWGITTEAAHSGTHSLTDSPGTNYFNNVDASAYLNANLGAATRPMLSFWQRYGLEKGLDYGFVEVSKDGGSSWARLFAVTGQSGTNWSKVQVDLGEYAGTQALIRFRLKSDAQNPYDGWYIDDVEIKDFDLASKGYPFYDPMDTAASPSNWVSSIWQQVPGSVDGGPGSSWQCLIGSGSQPGGDLTGCLTLNGTLNLATAVNPKLSFSWRAGSQNGNLFYAQVSTDGGKNWTSIFSWDSIYDQSRAWNRQQLDLTTYVGRTNLALRFQAYNRPPGYRLALDFQVDEVLVDEAPPDVGLTVGAGSDPRHSAQLNWTASTAPDFAYYAIYRSTSSGVDPTDTLVTTISNKATVSFQDTNLPLVNQTLYYRVLVYDTQGLHNWGGIEVSYRTAWGQLAGFPFTENFESGDAYWTCDWPWAISTEPSRSGTHCLSDSPGADYVNSADLSAYLRVNLGTATRPMLTFWQRYGFEPGMDYGFVEVSSDGGSSWARLYGVTSQSGFAWQQVNVDLGSYAGTQAIIRFRLKSDSANPYDGWYLDDVTIKEFGTVAQGYPFFDNMDAASSPSNWVASAWQQVPGSATSGSGQSWRCLIGNGSQPVGGDYNFNLTLNGTVNLQGAVNPKLWFWWRAGSQNGNLFYAQVSTDGGRNWTSLFGWDSMYDKSMAWTRQQVDLKSYVGYTNLTLRFLAYNRLPGYRFALDFQVDDVLISEGGDCPAILTMSPMPSATLGYAYNLILQTTNGNPPHLWAVVSNSLPPGLTLNPSSGIINGTPTNAGTFSFWLSVTASNACSQTKQFSLAVSEYLPLSATHSMQAFVSPGTNIIYCQVDNQTGRRLLSLAWAPALPAGWTNFAVAGDGGPEIGRDGKILFQAANLTNNPLKFSYSVRVPAGETQARQIGGAAIVLLESMIIERTVPAQPDPLSTQPRTYHSADCSANWIIETTEANRVLAYWRAFAYQLDPTSCDGYAPGSGTLIGAMHSADYQAPYWAIDGTELNRVLSYWRAGCYRKDAAGLDGYAAGCSNAPGLTLAKDASVPVITHQAPLTYTAGGSFLVTNTMYYSGTNLSLLWRPRLPAGWTISELFADGSPEKLGSDIVWTGAKIPSTPITVLYRVQVPAGEQGIRLIQNEVEYLAVGMVNPALAVASPDPLSLTSVTSPFVKFTSVKRLADGQVQLDLLGAVSGSVLIQFMDAVPAASSSPRADGLIAPSWNLLSKLPSLNGPLQVIDATATNAVQRFYRVVAP
ncbi:MAG: putative Ig domain-containing protein [Verrucomicrobiota bacterium]